MLLGTVPVAAAGGKITPRIPVSGTGDKVNYYTGSSARSGTAIQVTKPIAQRFTIEGDLEKLSMYCPSYNNNVGSLTFKLYQWNTSYEKTLYGEVLASKTFEDFTDNSVLEMSISKNVTGDLLLVVCDPVEKVGVWSNSSANPHSSDEIMYVDGVATPGKALNLTAYTAKVLNVNPDTDTDIQTFDAYSGITLATPLDSFNVTLDAEKPENGIAPTGVSYSAYLVDFGETSPKGAMLNVKNEVSDSAKVQIIADNLKSGQVLCEFYLELNDQLSIMQDIPSKIAENITGKHIIYLVTNRSGMRIYNLSFLKETPGPSWDEQRLADFEATKDYEIIDDYSDTWSATDLLGRKLPDHETVGDYNPDKKVGLFYWTWHGSRTQNMDFSINQKVINSYNGPESDIKNEYYYPGWKVNGIWNESIYGIYSGLDDWVMRKQMELFAASDIDALFFDCSNGTNAFTGAYMKLAETMHKMHLEGIQTPGMAFILPFFDMNYNVTDLEYVYESMYSIGLYSDTWFYWDGKPVIMGYPNALVKTAANDEKKAQHEEILDFFTFRPGQPDYRKGQYQENQWPWLEVYPQHPYGESEKYGCETVCVGVAMNANDKGLTAMNGTNVYGRSYTYKDRFSNLSETSKYYGYNFIEQWERAFELDPELVFVTGWNEWRAGHHEKWGGVDAAYPDQYNDEYSRDIEPTKGEFKDAYYYLLASYIRKFKGVRPTPVASEEKTINLSGSFSQWDNVEPGFVGYKGGTEPRNYYLLQKRQPVSNYTGRNDIVLSKVARDKDNLYFYVKTAENMSPYTDESWMRLFINTDRKYKTGWEGYDFILNRVNPTATTATLEKWVGSNIEEWSWETAAVVDYTISGNEMMISIPKAVLGIGDEVDIEFKWNDNMQLQGDIMDFYTNGDTAPVGRYAYRYTDEASVKNSPVDEPVKAEDTIGNLTGRLIVMAIGKSYGYVYGNKTQIDTQSKVTAPVIINDKTMIPVRFLSEGLGAVVTWDEKKQTVKIQFDEKRIQLELGSNRMKIEKEVINLQSPATEIENRIYIPLRDIVEAFGIECNWVEPGLILVGPGSEYLKMQARGGVDRLLKEYGFVN